MTAHKSISIQTVLEKCDRRYDFIVKFYADLAECAHPNHEGLIMGYSKPDRENMIENFSNRWQSLYSKTHELGMRIVIDLFEHEYNEVWPKRFAALEAFLAEHDAELEATESLTNH